MKVIAKIFKLKLASLKKIKILNVKNYHIFTDTMKAYYCYHYSYVVLDYYFEWVILSILNLHLHSFNGCL